jgi:hypothetical protein
MNKKITAILGLLVASTGLQASSFDRNVICLASSFFIWNTIPMFKNEVIQQWEKPNFINLFLETRYIQNPSTGKWSPQPTGKLSSLLITSSMIAVNLIILKNNSASSKKPSTPDSNKPYHPKILSQPEVQEPASPASASLSAASELESSAENPLATKDNNE